MKISKLTKFFLALTFVICYATQILASEAKLIIPYRFEDARPFSDGAAAVKERENWGYIDRFGQWLIEPKYPFPSVGDFSFGLAFVRDEFIRRDGTPAFELKFQNARAFRSDGERPVAPVQMGSLWGFIGLDGAVVIEPKFDDAGEFSPIGLAPVKIGGLWGYIDRKGRELVPPRFDFAWSFSGEFAAVLFEGQVGYIDRLGLFAIKPAFESGGAFKNGRALVKRNGKFGFINDKGVLVIPARFNGAGDFDGGLAPVATNSRSGFIDVNGKIVIPTLYDEAGRFGEGFAPVQQDGIWGYIGQK